MQAVLLEHQVIVVVVVQVVFSSTAMDQMVVMVDKPGVEKVARVTAQVVALVVITVEPDLVVAVVQMASFTSNINQNYIFIA